MLSEALVATRRSSVDDAAAHPAEHHGVAPRYELPDFEPPRPDTVVP